MSSVSTQRNHAVRADNAIRFSCLSSGVVRIEYSPSGVFEDRRSIRALTRPDPVEFMDIREVDNILTLDTGQFILSYAVGAGKLSDETLCAVAPGAKTPFWRHGQVDNTNLGGVHLSMDCVNREIIPEGVHEATSELYDNGSPHQLWRYRWALTGGNEQSAINADNYKGMSLADVAALLAPGQRPENLDNLLKGRSKYPPGLLSKAGYFLFDDSAGAVYDPEKKWLAPRNAAAGAKDLYLFYYGGDYRGALADYCLVFGHVPLIPRYSLGSWYSRFPTFDESGLRELIDEYEKHDLPLDVLVLDLEWHKYGWRGFDWDTNHIYDPEGFLSFLRDKQIHTTFNVHPDGVPYEDSHFEEFIRRAAIEVDEARRRDGGVFRDFDTSIRRHADAFMDACHKPIQDQGVDFWWIDGACPVDPKHGVDRQLWTNHVYKTHMEQNYADRRPMIFSRTSGFGSHRYPFHFTGDTFSHWEVLKSQVEYTLRAGHIGQSFITHDIGGHLHDYEKLDPELYCRWVQWGALSPAFRLHSSAGGERRPYAYEEKALVCVQRALQLRMELIPYLYTLAWESATDGMPMCRSCCLEQPWRLSGFDVWDSYFLGDRIYAAPVLTPGNVRTVLLPPGAWYRYGEREMLQADGVATRPFRATSQEAPLHFCKAGSILVKQQYTLRAATIPERMIIEAYSAPDSFIDEFELYEDDGMSQLWLTGAMAHTSFSLAQEPNTMAVTIAPCQGSFTGMPHRRSYELRVIGKKFTRATVSGRAEPLALQPPDDSRWYWSAVVEGVDTREGCTVEFQE